MPNEIQIECYFKSAEIAKLCEESNDIMIKFKASYPPDSPPTFEISATGFTEGVSYDKAILSADKPSAATSADGCPTPCR